MESIGSVFGGCASYTHTVVVFAVLVGSAGRDSAKFFLGHILAWSVWLPCLPPSSGRGNGGWWFAWVGFGATLRGCATRRHGSSPSSRMVHNTRTTFVLCVAVASPCEDLDSPIGASDGDSASVPGQILKTYYSTSAASPRTPISLAQLMKFWFD